MSQHERTGLRDRELLNWHCINDVHCRAAGVQFLMIEYVWGKPVMLVEYRRYRDGRPNTAHPIYRAICDIAGPLPFFIAYCETNTFGFFLEPLNSAARHLQADPLMSEAEFAGWLHDMRAIKPKEREFPRGLGRARPTSRPNEPMTVPSLLVLDGAPYPGAEVSRKRRLWGYNVPAVDVDYLLVDNNDARALALVEYKRGNAVEINWERDTNIEAQRLLAQRVGLPFLVMRYWVGPTPTDCWRFAVDGPPETRPLYPETLATGEQWLGYLRSMRGQAAA